MPLKKTIAENFKNSFSRYLTDNRNSNHHVRSYVWLRSPDRDNKKLETDSETTASEGSPSNGFKNVDVVTDTTNVCSQTKPITETEKQGIQLSFDCQKEDENINGFDVADQTEAETAQGLFRDLASLESGENLADIGGNESTVSDELSKYIKLYERRGEKCSASEINDMAFITGIEATENSSQPTTAIDPIENCQKLSTVPIEDMCTYDSAYDVLPDPYNPMLFHMCLKTSNQTTDLQRIAENVIARHQSFYFNGLEIKPCFIPLRDFRVKLRKPNPLENMTFFVDKPLIVNDVPKRSRSKRNRTKPVRQQQQKQAPAASPPRKKPLKLKRGRIGKSKKKNRKTVLEATDIPIETPIEIQVQETPTILIEEKTASINEWLQLSAMAQPDNNMDVNEFLQYANLPTLSDIEDDAFQLARYLEATEQANAESRGIEPVNTVPLQLPQPSNDEIPLNLTKPVTESLSTQPLDLSTKPITPIATETGFCNERVSIEVPPTITDGGHWNGGAIALKTIDRMTEQRNVENQFFDGQNKANYVVSQVPSTTWDPNPFIPQNMALKENVSTVTSSESQLKSYYVAETIMKVASEVEKPQQRCIFQPNPLAMDWKEDNYSTDLDYEPSEDEKDDVIDDFKFSNEFQQKKNVTELETGLDTAPAKTRNRIVIKVPNNQSDVRIVTGSFSEAVDSKLFTSAPANKVEPLRRTSCDKNKPSSIAQRTVTNLPSSLMQPASENQIGLLRSQVNFLFNRPCFDYMNDNRCQERCPKNHNLPSSREVFQKLMLFPDDTIMSLYSIFIVKNRMSFVNFFPAICKVFGIRKMKSSLLAAVKDCERHQKCEYYVDIYHSLIRTDMSRLNAVSRIADYSCKNRIACTVILNIIVKEDPLSLIAILRKFYRHANIQTHHMLGVLYQLVDNQSPSLLKVFIEMFDQYSKSDISDIASYKMIYWQAKTLLKYDVKLLQRLNSITSRDKRINI